MSWGGGCCLHSHLELSGSCDLEQQVHIWQGAVCFLPGQHSIFSASLDDSTGLGGGEHRTVGGLASLPESFSPLSAVRLACVVT